MKRTQMIFMGEEGVTHGEENFGSESFFHKVVAKNFSDLKRN